MRGVNIRSHHRQRASGAGSRAGSSTLVTDPLRQSAAITARFLGANADLAPAAINDLGAFSRISKVVCIAALYVYLSSTISTARFAGLFWIKLNQCVVEGFASGC
jgi:hypothetical protein